MVNVEPVENRSPYPLRQSESLAFLEGVDQIEPLQLTEEERQALGIFEESLFNKLKEIKDVPVGIHTIYLDYLLTDEGWEKFRQTYSECDDQVNQWAKPKTWQEAQAYFFQVKNLHRADNNLRKEFANTSEIEARNKFVADLIAANGDISQVNNPYRASRIVRPDGLEKKIIGYRQFKLEIKRMEEEVDNESGSFEEAKQIVLKLYRRYLNTLIADFYDEGVVWANEQGVSLSEKKRRTEVFSGLTPEVEERKNFLFPEAERTLARIDHFFWGVGGNLGADELYKTAPDRLGRILKEKVREPKSENRSAYEYYGKYLVNSSRAKEIAEAVAGCYGGKGIWQFRERTMPGFSAGQDKQGRPCVWIPKNLNKRLPDLLVILAHEQEGHQLRYANAKMDLKILSEYGTGRSGAVSEVGSMMVEERTAKESFGITDRNVRAYYQAMEARIAGGSFKECYLANLVARVGGEDELARVILDPSRAKLILNESFRQTQRVFRAGRPPLDDRSGYIVNSEELAYQEHLVVGPELESLGLERVLFIANVDLYSIKDLLRLGVVNWKNVVGPKYVVSRVIWPKLKEALDRGESLDQAIEGLQDLEK